jgi:hypothetical protein
MRYCVSELADFSFATYPLISTISFSRVVFLCRFQHHFRILGT